MTAERCEDCGDACPTWYADDDRWNYVTAHMPRGRGSILCPTCFIGRWSTVTQLTARWRLTPEMMRPADAATPPPEAFACSAPDEMTPPRASPPPAFFRGRITDTGGGMCTVLIDRDTENYPRVGTRVVVDELDTKGR